MSQHIENNSEFPGLNVNSGVAQPPIVNPYMKHRAKRARYTTDEFVAGILRGDVSILSQAVTLVESTNPMHYAQAQEVVEKCLPHAGNSVRIGITGVPGAGKSTFVESLGMDLVRAGRKLAVLAIDPSSERSRGSILGDKTRMEELSAAKLLLSGHRLRRGRWVAWHAKRAKPSYYAKPPGSTRCLSKLLAWDRAKRQYTAWSISFC